MIRNRKAAAEKAAISPEVTAQLDNIQQQMNATSDLKVYLPLVDQYNAICLANGMTGSTKHKDIAILNTMGIK